MTIQMTTNRIRVKITRINIKSMSQKIYWVCKNYKMYLQALYKRRNMCTKCIRFWVCLARFAKCLNKDKNYENTTICFALIILTYFHRDPSKRLKLEDIVKHDWLKGARSLSTNQNTSKENQYNRNDVIGKELHETIVEKMIHGCLFVLKCLKCYSIRCAHFNYFKVENVIEWYFTLNQR